MTTPTRFGRYEFLERIAQGGMAEVFLARTVGASGFEKELVIKRILPEFSRDQQFVKMFVDEARIAAQLHHPNIVQVFDFDHVEGTYFIAMEYVEGIDLRSILEEASLRGERLDLGECLYVVMEVAKALDYAHRRHVHGKPLEIIHRDVSPHNVLVSFDGAVKLTDFGIAKAASRVTRTQDGVVKGKVAYMSPEQARGHRIDARSDLFSLGTMFFELVTMRRLFYADSDREILRKVMAADVPSPRSYNRKLPAEVERIIMKLLARPLEKRYGSAAELLAALGPVYHKLAESSPELSLRQRLKELFPDRRRQEARAEAPGSWPPQLEWPSRSGTPVLPDQPKGRAAPPPIPTDVIRPEASPPRPRSDSSPGVRAGSNGNGGGRGGVDRRTPLPSPGLGAAAAAGWPDPTVGFADTDDEDTEPVFPLAGGAAEPAVRQRRRRVPGGRAFELQEVVTAEPAPLSKDLFEKGTVLYPSDESAPTGDSPVAKKRPRWQLKRTLLAASFFVLAGVAVGVAFALVRAPGDEHQAAPQGAEAAAAAGETAESSAVDSDGTVIVRSVPLGARVLVDGEDEVGHTPLTLSVPLNRETRLVIAMDGYQPEEVSVTATDPHRPSEQLVRLRPAQ